MTRLNFGFIPLTDCAPLAVALEKGFFRRHGLDVTLSREASWANIRDKVAVGALDGAQMLAGMPIAASLGIGAIFKPMITACSMDLNGNAVTVCIELYERMLAADPEAARESPMTARALKKVIEIDRAQGKAPMTFAMVFPVSTHNYEIRYWMASAGIDPDEDVRLVVIPPPQMVANLRARAIVGYCVGEPWNTLAVLEGVGRTVITGYEIWNNKPEKVFGVNLDWAERNGAAHKAAIMALIETAQWMDEPENRMEIADILTANEYVHAPVDVVKMSITGTFKYAAAEEPKLLPDFNVFYRYAATFPWRSHAEWFITQMYRWGQIDRVIDIRQAAAAIYRTDIYREVAGELGVPCPTEDYKTEGTQDGPWLLEKATQPIAMGSDRFFDGKPYDPSALLTYLGSFPVNNLQVALQDLAACNA
jgi:ABC-type nitrate/sulfonate/bicarbonate transport system substrate-binding protein